MAQMTEIEKLEIQLKCMKLVEGTDVKWWKIIRARETKSFFAGMPTFAWPIGDYEFALGVIEGRPVWAENTIYFNKTGFGVVAGCHTYPLTNENYSWNPPKPKTVMIELLVESAEFYSKYYDVIPLGVACKKALEELE